MYIPRPILILVVFIYLLFLLSADWITSADGAWYRPFLIAAATIAAGLWAHREQGNDDY